MTDTQLADLATTITNNLMSNAHGDVATRLQLKQYAPKDSFRDKHVELDLGGYCRASVYQIVANALNEARAADARVSARLKQDAALEAAGL